jgi:hypothetical protein
MSIATSASLAEQLPFDYLELKMSIPEIARKTGLPKSRIRILLISMNVPLRTRTEGVRLSKRNGRGIGKNAGRHIRTEEMRKKMSSTKLKWAEKNAKGFRITQSGYVEFTRGKHKGRSQHVVVAEAALGRPLSPQEVVHHKDRNRSNNSVENLMVMTRSEHMRLHRKEDRRWVA